MKKLVNKLKVNVIIAFKVIYRIFLKCVDDIFFIIGIILFSKGVFEIFIPAGYIVLGICFMAFAFFIVKRGG